MILNLDKLNCESCPAQHLLNFELIEKNEKLREIALTAIDNVRLILLGESTPANRFVYDLNTDYSNNGLRFNLRYELVDGNGDKELMSYLTNNGIIILDTALCPLHKLNSKKDRRDASTICLKRHTIKYFNYLKAVPIITFFPSRCGFKKSEINILNSRIKAEFSFSDLKGLKEIIESIISEKT